MDFITILGLIGTLLTIIAFFFPSEWKNKTISKIIFTIILIILSSLIISQNNKINRIKDISKSANLLVETKSTEFTHEGFILAALSFLEQNKNDYPESYKRAVIIFDKYNNDEDRELKSVRISYEMEGLLKGISILSMVKDDQTENKKAL